MDLRETLLRPLQDLANFILPPICPLCSQSLSAGEGTGFCFNCLQLIPPLPVASCRRCALPYPTDISDDHLCGICLNEKTALFERVIAAGIYDGTLKEAIHRFKYRDKINLDRPLAELLFAQLPDLRPPDLVMPVPLHRRRLRQRTYNQSALLARLLANKLDRPIELRQLVRHRDTPPQQGQSAIDRKINLKNAFSLTHPMNGESILLVDDVLTTGATIRECCRVLKKNGAGTITVAILARAKAY
jgi:ComF family protein